MKTISKAVAAMLLMTTMLLFVKCNPDDNPEPNNEDVIEVVTRMPSDITVNSAVCGCDVGYNPEYPLSEIGVCWSKEPSPTLNDSHLSTTEESSGFDCTITDLEPSTEYHVRGYARRDSECVYGEDRSFTTLELVVEDGLHIWFGVDTEITQTTVTFPIIEVVVQGFSFEEVGLCLCLGHCSPTEDDIYYAIAEGTAPFDLTVTGLVPGKAYYVFAYGRNGTEYYYENEGVFLFHTQGCGGLYNGNYEYVDLGLPNGTLWATCNVGADSPEGYGDYFAWGETQPKETYDGANYQHCVGNLRNLTKYNYDPYWGYNGFVDHKFELEPEDDAATVNWGNEWCMPQGWQWWELFQNTTVTAITQNGTAGYLFTASNGNSMFLPSAGYRSVNSLNDNGRRCIYWSADLSTESLYDDPANAVAYRNPLEGDEFWFWAEHDMNRENGCLVRAVRSSRSAR